jgi:hypothetical protein
MKKSLIKSIKVLSLCLVLSLFVGIAIVDAQSAPANNVYGPLNVGPTMQSKVGSLRITDGGIRTAGPGLFDDIVIIGYSDGSAPSSGSGTASLPATKKVSFFEKLSNLFGLNTEKAIAANTTGVVTGGGITPLGSCNPACTGYSTCQLVSAPNNYQCVLPACTLNCPSGTCQWGTNGMYCEGIASPTGGNVNSGVNSIGGSAIGLGNLATTTYKLTVNGMSNLNGYAKVEGGLDVAGAITSGGKNVCLQDGTNCVQQSASSSAVAAFGGTYNEIAGVGGVWTCDSSSKNPITSACSCPSGFTSYQMMSYLTGGIAYQGAGKVISGFPPSPSNVVDHPAGWVTTSPQTKRLMGCYKFDSGVPAGVGKGS